MPLILSEMHESDISAFALVDEAAMADWPFAKAMQNPGERRRDLAEKWTRGSWGKNPEIHWMKVTDEDSGEMAAAACWRFEMGEAPEEAKKEDEARKEMREGKMNEKAGLWAEMARHWREFETECNVKRPRAVLNILVTSPKYQRRGAGSMLVKWGCDRADALGIICALQASAAGEQVYARQGFEVKRVGVMDLRPYGVEAEELRRGMVRLPRKKQEGTT